jgi:3-oxosteroid 1-dehydrogenase
MQSRVEKDVVVLGTGAAGLTAALSAALAGAEVGLYEKANLLGGSTAISGGVTWVPQNHLQDAAGIVDSREDAVNYLNSLSLGRMDPALAQTFVDNGRGTVQWLEEVTALRFTLLPNYPDYHPENPGGKPDGGRSLDPGLFSYASLGPWQEKVSRSKRGAHLKITDTTLGGGAGFLEPDELQRRVDNDLRGCGSALIGPIIKALLDLGVEPVLGATATELIVEDGRVTGVQLVINGVEQTVYARRGVILATGGFEWNSELVKEFLRGPMTAPTSVPTNTGDGLLMSMRAGARLGNMGQAWWVPAVKIPGDIAFGAERSNLVNRERTLPGSIMVNRYGRRFTNEATNYNALGGAFHQMDPMSFGYTNLPAWLIFDGRNAQRYGSFGTPAGEPIADWIPRADSLKSLAEQVGMILMDLKQVWIAGTILLTLNQMQTLVAVTAPTTAGVVTGNIGSRRPQHWGESMKHLSTLCRLSPALWAPAVVHEQTPPDAYWTPTRSLFLVFTR